MNKFGLFTAIAVVGVLLGGCQTGQLWRVTSSKDQFTDKVTKMVTIGEGLSDNLIITRSLRYYPFVGVQEGEIYVGLRSGGRYPIPTGTVQIRIDENTAWTITPEETPIYLAPALPSSPLPATTEQSDVILNAQAKMMENMTKSMSPYTATTGQKAKSIIKEILKGKVMIYRTIGFNQAASTTGEVRIDDSFKSSLQEIGITPEML